MMAILVIAWGFDYVPAKWGMEVMSPMVLLFFKYAVGVAVMLIIKAVQKNWTVIRLKDVPIFIICAIVGEIIYFGCEYSAMDYLPVSLITIILTFVPVVSIISERIIYKRSATKKIIIGILICIVGVTLVIGTDFSVIMQGRGICYLLAIGAVLSWNGYNFITASLERYDSITISFTQMLCTIILLTPMAIHNIPPASEFNKWIIFGILWIGIVNSGVGFLIYVYGLQKLGPTTMALYSDFLPVSTTFFGALMLKESISTLQIIGGIIVVGAAFVVIREKGRVDEEREAVERAEAERQKETSDGPI